MQTSLPPSQAVIGFSTLNISLSACTLHNHGVNDKEIICTVHYTPTLVYNIKEKKMCFIIVVYILKCPVKQNKKTH